MANSFKIKPSDVPMVVILNFNMTSTSRYITTFAEIERSAKQLEVLT